MIRWLCVVALLTCLSGTAIAQIRWVDEIETTKEPKAPGSEQEAWQVAAANPTIANLRRFLASFPKSERRGEIEGIANEILREQLREFAPEMIVSGTSVVLVDIPPQVEAAAYPAERHILIRDAFKYRWAAVLEVHSNPAQPFTIVGPFASIGRASDSTTQERFEVMSGSGYIVVKEIEVAAYLVSALKGEPARLVTTPSGLRRVYTFFR